MTQQNAALVEESNAAAAHLHAQASQLRQENAIVRQILAAYDEARKVLMGELSLAYSRLGDNPSREAVRLLASNASLIQAIEQRIASLGATLTQEMRAALTEMLTATADDVSQQVLLLANALEIGFIRFGIDELVELTIQTAIDQIPGIVQTLQTSIVAELRSGLAQGQRFSELRDRLFTLNNAIFPRAKTSAELMVRRAVIQANNNARQIFIDRAAEQVPGLARQVVARIGGDTTKLCLRAHGQIQPIGKPFELSSGPPDPFQRKMMAPPFHWNCRTSVVPYHPRFEQTSSLTTADMITAAQAELAKLETAAGR
jgi:hypothetical protein